VQGHRNVGQGVEERADGGGLKGDFGGSPSTKVSAKPECSAIFRARRTTSRSATAGHTLGLDQRNVSPPDGTTNSIIMSRAPLLPACGDVGQNALGGLPAETELPALHR